MTDDEQQQPAGLPSNHDRETFVELELDEPELEEPCRIGVELDERESWRRGLRDASPFELGGLEYS